MSAVHQSHTQGALTAMQARGEVMKLEGCASPSSRGWDAASARAAGPVSPAAADMLAVICTLRGAGHFDLARRVEACWRRGPAVVDALLKLVRQLQADHEREELSPGVTTDDLEEAWALLGDVAGVEASTDNDHSPSPAARRDQPRSR